MDTLNLVSEINNKISALENKIEKTSRSASVAFSYLYSRLDAAYSVTPEAVSSMNVKYDDMLTKYSYTSILLSNMSYDVNSYVTVVNSYIDNINSYITDINSKLSDFTTNDTFNRTLSIKSNITDAAINELRKSIEKITLEVAEIKEQVNKIETCPEKFIIIKAKRSGINRLIDSLSEFFYKLFHQKEIRLARKAAEEEKIRLAEEEERKKQEEIERQKLEAEKAKKAEQRKKNETRSKINNLLKNK